MKITANLLDRSSDTATTSVESLLENQQTNELDSPLQRLCQNVMSGQEIIALLQQYWMLPQLQREMLIDEYLAGVTCSEAEVFSAYKTFYQKHQINSDADRDAWLERNRCTISQFEHSVLRTIKLDRFKSETFGSKVDAYFLKCKDRLDRASYSLLRVKDPHLAQELFFRIQAGEASFTELAKQYSGGQEAQIGGSIGPHDLSIPHPILAKKLRSLQPGELSSPLQVADWFVVMRLDKYFPAQLDESMRIRSIDELYEQWLQEQLQQLQLV